MKEKLVCIVMSLQSDLEGLWLAPGRGAWRVVGGTGHQAGVSQASGSLGLSLMGRRRQGVTLLSLPAIYFSRKLVVQVVLSERGNRWAPLPIIISLFTSSRCLTTASLPLTTPTGQVCRKGGQPSEGVGPVTGRTLAQLQAINPNMIQV